MLRYKVYADPDWITPDRILALPPRTLQTVKALAYLRQNPAWPLLQLEHPSLVEEIEYRLPSEAQGPLAMAVADALLSLPNVTNRHWEDFLEFGSWYHPCAYRKTSQKKRYYARMQCLLCLEKILMRWDRHKHGRVFSDPDRTLEMHLIVKHAPLLKRLQAVFLKPVIAIPDSNGVLRRIT